MKLNEPLSNWLLEQLAQEGFHLPDQNERVARAIVDLSNGFQLREGRLTPWETAASRGAYLSYFFPLNYLRIRRVLEQLPSVFIKNIDRVVEIGSGAGNFHLAWADTGMKACEYEVVEKSNEAFNLHLRLAEDFHLPRPQRRPSAAKLRFAPKTLLVLSYTLNELSLWPEELLLADHLLVIEPSQMEAARHLMGLRQTLLGKGFFPVGPCTHFGSCPLLEHSKRDFCHDRFFVQLPKWMLLLENHLPMTNRTLTHSWLAMAKDQALASFRGQTRVLGDTLFERGKIRQAICRSDRREFLSVLKRDIKHFKGYAHGALIELPSDIECKGNEVRLKGP